MTIFPILGHFGGQVIPPYKLFFSKYDISNFLIWFQPFENYLIEYCMNIFSKLIRYFVKLVIFIKKYQHFRRWKLLLEERFLKVPQGHKFAWKFPKKLFLVFLHHKVSFSRLTKKFVNFWFFWNRLRGTL